MFFEIIEIAIYCDVDVCNRDKRAIVLARRLGLQDLTKKIAMETGNKCSLRSNPMPSDEVETWLCYCHAKKAVIRETRDDTYSKNAPDYLSANHISVLERCDEAFCAGVFDMIDIWIDAEQKHSMLVGVVIKPTATEFFLLARWCAEGEILPPYEQTLAHASSQRSRRLAERARNSKQCRN